MNLGKFLKQPAEREAYAIEYEADLTNADAMEVSMPAPVMLVEVQGMLADSTPLAVDLVTVLGTRITIWISGGTNGANYKITVTASTVSGRVLQDEFYIRVKDI